MNARGLLLILPLALGCLPQAGPVFAADARVAQAEGASDTPKPKLVDLWRPGDPGERMNIRGRVTSVDGRPLPGIRISIRQANGAGDYTDQYRATLVSDAQGRYQFGTVLPNNYSGAKHVHVTVYQDGWEYYDTSILFEGDPNLEYHYEDGTPIFLEEATVRGETMLFGRFDIVLTPD